MRYHLLPHGVFDPYFGVGPAIEAVFNVALGGQWFANFKQVFLDTEARINSGRSPP